MCDEKLNDPVNHPSHYLKAAITIEPIELTARLDACLGQAVNYIVRAPYKGNEIEDLYKAAFYLRKYNEVMADATFVERQPSEVALVLGRIFAKNSANPFVKKALTELFKSRYFYEDNINSTLAVIDDWIPGYGIRGLKE